MHNGIEYELVWSPEEAALVVVSLEEPEKKATIPGSVAVSVGSPRNILARDEDLVYVLKRMGPVGGGADGYANAFFRLGANGGTKKLDQLVQLYEVRRDYLPGVKLTEEEMMRLV